MKAASAQLHSHGKPASFGTTALLNSARPTMQAIKADLLTAGRVVWLEGFRFNCVGVRPDPVGNGTVEAPRPRILADLVWSGEGRDPGPGYHTMTSGRAPDHCWTVEALH